MASDEWREAHALFKAALDPSAGDIPSGIEPGTVIGSYTIVRELGRGGMGHVYLANDARLGRQVALKALAPELVGNDAHRERLRREARAAGVLTHPGICTVYALEDIDGEMYLASEYIAGTTLREEIASGDRPAPADMIRTAHEMASALSAAHERGIVHRDLKPENIMRTRDGRIKILDFGLARVSSEAGHDHSTLATHPGLLVGTPAYMAPEQLTGKPADARADVFAYGVLLYEYVSGVHPFAAASPLAMMARVLESDVRPLLDRCPQAPVQVLDVVARCLRKAPEERLQSGGEIVGALDRRAEDAATGSRTWWLTHQLLVMAAYIGIATLGWYVKFWLSTPVTVALFIGLGAAAAVAGGVRGHLAFTAVVNRPHLAHEWRRLRRPLRVTDLLMAAALAADAILLSRWALTAMLTMAAASGLGLVALVLDPATGKAVVGDKSG